MNVFRPIPEKYLRAIAYGIIGIIVATPLYTFSNYFFPFVVPRNIIFRIAVEALLIIYALLVVQDRKYLPRRNGVTLFFGLFVIALSIASLFGVDPAYSFWSSYERMEGLITLYHLSAFLLIIMGFSRHEKAWDIMLGSSLLVGFIVAMVGLSQFLNVNVLLSSSGGERISSTIGNATYLAAYLLLHIFVAFYFLLKHKESLQSKMFVYGIIGIDAVILALQGYALWQGSPGILNQIFSSWLFGLFFLVVHILIYATIVPRLRDHATIYLRTCLAMLAILFLFIVSVTQTRGALVGLGAAGIVCYTAILLQQRSKKLLISSSLVVVLVIVSIVGIFTYKNTRFVQQTPILNKIATISLSDRTTLSRLVTWRSGLKGVSESPRRMLLGWGMENFSVVFNKYFPTEIYTDEGTPLWFDRPHNIVVQYLVEGGMVTALLYLIFIGVVVIQLLRKKDSDSAAMLLAGAIVAYFVQNLFVFDSINSSVPFFLLIGFAISLLHQRATQKNDTEKRSFASVQGGMIALVITVVSLFMIFSINTPILSANRSFVSAYKQLMAATESSTATEKDFEAVIDAIDRSPFLGRYELLATYSEYMVGMIQEKRLPEATSREAVAPIVERYDAYRAKKLTDARFNLLELNLLLNSGNLDRSYLDKVIALGTETVPLTPDRPQLYYVIGRAYMAKHDYINGIKQFQRAVALAPNVFDSHWNLFAAYVTIDNDDGAHSEFVELQRVQPFDVRTYNRVVALLGARYKYDFAIKVIEQALVTYPNSADLYIGLANIYAAQGNNDEARKATNRAIELDPTLTNDGKKFLELLDKGELKQAKPTK